MQAAVASAEEAGVREVRGAREKGEMQAAASAEEEGVRDPSPAGGAPGAGVGSGAREKAEAEATLAGWQDSVMALRRSHMQAIIYKLGYNL